MQKKPTTMNINDFETLGFYEPGLLHLRVNTDFDIFDLNTLYTNPKTKKYFSTFLHEYVHFIQDIATTSGLMNSVFYIDFIKDINWKIRHDGKPDFKVPVKISNYNNIEANIALRKIYRGETKGSKLVKYDRYTTEYITVKDKDNNEVKPINYKVHYYDLTTRELKYLNFGYACLKEYVAHVIQKEYFPLTEHDDIPYQIAEQIVLKEYPNFGNNQWLFVALCDASLMCYHPAQMFFNTIERMKKESFVPKSTSEVYDFAFKDLTFNGQNGTETVVTLYEKTVELASSQLYDALKSEIFLPNYNWIKHILNKSKELRLKHPNFISELVKSEGQLSDLYFEIFRVLGTPFFTNKKEKGGFVPAVGLAELPNQPYQLLVFKQVINLYGGQQNCSLFDFCKIRPDKDITNKNCKYPWKKASEQELCPFGQIWKTWGLINEEPIF